MTVSVSPEFSGAWNPRKEVGLGWLCRSLDLAAWHADRRYASYDERDAHIRELAVRLPWILGSAKGRGASLWPEVQALLRREIK